MTCSAFCLRNYLICFLDTFIPKRFFQITKVSAKEEPLVTWPMHWLKLSLQSSRCSTPVKLFSKLNCYVFGYFDPSYIIVGITSRHFLGTVAIFRLKKLHCSTLFSRWCAFSVSHQRCGAQNEAMRSWDDLIQQVSVCVYQECFQGDWTDTFSGWLKLETRTFSGWLNWYIGWTRNTLVNPEPVSFHCAVWVCCRLSFETHDSLIFEDCWRFFHCTIQVLKIVDYSLQNTSFEDCWRLIHRRTEGLASLRLGPSLVIPFSQSIVKVTLSFFVRIMKNNVRRIKVCQYYNNVPSDQSDISFKRASLVATAMAHHHFWIRHNRSDIVLYDIDISEYCFSIENNLFGILSSCA